MAEAKKLVLKREYAKDPVKARDDLLKHFRVATCSECNPVYHHCIRGHSCMYEPDFAENACREEIDKMMTHRAS